MPDPIRELAKAQPDFIPAFYRQRSDAQKPNVAPVSPLLGRGHLFALLIGLVIGYAYAHAQYLNREARDLRAAARLEEWETLR